MFQIQESEAAGYTVATVTLTDDDYGETLTYSITGKSSVSTGKYSAGIGFEFAKVYDSSNVFQ